MRRKITSLLLSLLLCLSLLPGLARSEKLPDPVEPPAATEPLDPQKPEEPEEPLLPMGLPDKEENGHTTT